jgi:hypothetical protein
MSWKVFAKHTDAECKCGWKGTLLDIPVDDECICYCPKCETKNPDDFEFVYHKYAGGQ